MSSHTRIRHEEMIMKLRTSSNTQRQSGVASIVLAMALVSGTMAFSTPALSDGGTPIGDQGIEARRQNEALKHNGGAPQPQYNNNRGSGANYHGNTNSRGNYQSHNNSNDRRYYDDHRHYSRNYHYTPRYDSYSYGYAEPYAYAPYDAYSSPGISLFFNF